MRASIPWEIMLRRATRRFPIVSISPFALLPRSGIAERHSNAVSSWNDFWIFFINTSPVALVLSSLNLPSICRHCLPCPLLFHYLHLSAPSSLALCTPHKVGHQFHPIHAQFRMSY